QGAHARRPGRAPRHHRPGLGSGPRHLLGVVRRGGAPLQQAGRHAPAQRQRWGDQLDAAEAAVVRRQAARHAREREDGGQRRRWEGEEARLVQADRGKAQV
ncbi:hypothetical protein LTR53_019405, partial [Teratosphaeriaceae sp. CCFEE 6253]